MTALRRLRSSLKRLRPPVLEDDRPSFEPAALPMFIAIAVVVLGGLSLVADLSTLGDFRLLSLIGLIALTELMAIRVVPEREIVINDLFYVVPMVVLPPGESATLILGTVLLDAAIDRALHPRAVVHVLARLSSNATSRVASLAGILITGPFVGDDIVGITIMVIGAHTTSRINDYLFFPLTIRIAIGDRFRWRNYWQERLVIDGYILLIDLPITLVAAYAFDRTWLSILLLFIPYVVVWRLTLLAPRVLELERADELKSSFLSMTSHELRTPLTTIRGTAATLQQHWDRIDDEQRRQLLSLIDDQGARLHRLVNDLLTMSSAEAGALRAHPQNVEIGPLLEQSLAPFDDVRPPACPPGLRVRVDPGQFEQIVINLISNAHKYGRPPIEVTVEQVEDMVELHMRDHGPGVPELFVPELFERFTQAARRPDEASVQGTGLGLSIVRELAHLQHGDVRYERPPSGGAEFIVRLPAA